MIENKIGGSPKGEESPLVLFFFLLEENQPERRWSIIYIHLLFSVPNEYTKILFVLNLQL